MKYYPFEFTIFFFFIIYFVNEKNKFKFCGLQEIEMRPQVIFKVDYVAVTK